MKRMLKVGWKGEGEGTFEVEYSERESFDVSSMVEIESGRIYYTGFDSVVGIGGDVEELKESVMAYFIGDAIRHRIEVYGVMEREADFGFDERAELLAEINRVIAHS